MLAFFPLKSRCLQCRSTKLSLTKIIKSMEKKYEDMPLWQLSVNELKLIISHMLEEKLHALEDNGQTPTTRVYGIQGLADLLHCSRTKASQIKKLGLIDEAITQVGRKIVIDAELAIKLLNKRRK